MQITSLLLLERNIPVNIFLNYFMQDLLHYADVRKNLYILLLVWFSGYYLM